MMPRALLAAALLLCGCSPATRKPWRAALLSAGELSGERAGALRREGYSAVVLPLGSGGADAAERERRAAQTVLDSGLELHYWIEVARHPPLAESHPEWMASLQGHEEWRRFFPDAPEPGADEVVKVYPWVPVLYAESFEAQRRRIERILKDRPAAAAVYLNDLQGAPSACGCGHPLCRWTSDYGPKRTATPLGDDAAAKFVAAAKKIAGSSRVVPVWATECEEHDGAADGLCAGVGCFRGICWKAFSRQLEALSREAPRVAVLGLYKTFERDLPIYGGEAGWITQVLRAFATMPPRNGASPLPATRLVPILQGWNVTKEELDAQIRRAEEAGVPGLVVAFQEIDQGWSPRVVKLGRSGG